MVINQSPEPQGVEKYFLALQGELEADLNKAAAIPHPGGRGDEAELDWHKMLQAHLPRRYAIYSKSFVVDHRGECSQEIDLLLCDQQYSPLVFRSEARLFVPAEAVYGCFEVKPRINREHVLYAAEKAASVRRLDRTSASIVHAGGIYEEVKRPSPILAGLLSATSGWADGLGTSFEDAIRNQNPEGRLDLGCALLCCGWEVHYGDGAGIFEASVPEHALVFFFIRLLSRLQSIGTVPAMDLAEWGRFLRLR